MSRRSFIFRLGAALAVLAAGAIAQYTLTRDGGQPVEHARPIKMGCEDVVEKMDKYIDGEFNCKMHIHAFTRHLKRCKHCRSFYENRLECREFGCEFGCDFKPDLVVPDELIVPEDLVLPE